MTPWRAHVRRAARAARASDGVRLPRALTPPPHQGAWAPGAFGSAEAAASALTGVGAAHAAGAAARATGHELGVVRVPLTGARAASDGRAWVAHGFSGHIGALFACAIARAFATKAAAIAYLRLPPGSAAPDFDHMDGPESPLAAMFQGEAGVLLRAYPVEEWR